MRITATTTVILFSIFFLGSSASAGNPLSMTLTVASPTVTVTNPTITKANVYSSAKNNPGVLQPAGTKSLNCVGMPQTIIIDRKASTPFWGIQACIEHAHTNPHVFYQPVLMENGDLVFGVEFTKDEKDATTGKHSLSQVKETLYVHLPRHETIPSNTRFIAYLPELP